MSLPGGGPAPAPNARSGPERGHGHPGSGPDDLVIT